MEQKYEKFKELIVFLARHPSVKKLGVTKLWKLVYFSDVAHLRAHGKTITDLPYRKLPQGPVPPSGEQVLKSLKDEGAIAVVLVDDHGHSRFSVTSRRVADEAVFTAEELETIDEIIKKYGRSTASRLSRESHLEPAWLQAGHCQLLDRKLMLYGAAEDPDGL